MWLWFVIINCSSNVCYKVPHLLSLFSDCPMGGQLNKGKMTSLWRLMFMHLQRCPWSLRSSRSGSRRGEMKAMSTGPSLLFSISFVFVFVIIILLLRLLCLFCVTSTVHLSLSNAVVVIAVSSCDRRVLYLSSVSAEAGREEIRNEAEMKAESGSGHCDLIKRRNRMKLLLMATNLIVSWLKCRDNAFAGHNSRTDITAISRQRHSPKRQQRWTRTLAVVIYFK